MIGLTTWAVYKSLNRWKIPSLIVASAVGSLTNTILVLSSLALFSQINWSEMVGTRFLTFFLTILSTYGVLEATAAIVICTAVVVAWKRIDTGGKGSSLEDLDEGDA